MQHVGAYDNEEAAARTYDLAALKYWGTETTLNFPVTSHCFFDFFSQALTIINIHVLSSCVFFEMVMLHFKLLHESGAPM